MKRYVQFLSALLLLAPALLAPAAQAGGPPPKPTFVSSPAPLGGYSIKTYLHPETAPPAPLAGHSISGYRFFEPPGQAPSEGDSGETRFGSALNDFNSGRYSEAAANASGMINAFAGTPWEGRAAFLAGRAYAQLKNFSSASSYFALAREKCPSIADYSLYILAGQYSENKMQGDAAKTYMQLVREYPESPLMPESAVNAADEYLSLGRYREVIGTLKPLAGRKLSASLAAKSLYLRMSAYGKLGETKAALEIYRELWLDYPEFSLSSPGFSVRPPSGEDYMKRGDALFEKGIYRQALECYRDALKKLPKKSKLRGAAYVRLGESYLKLKESDKAEAALKDALSSSRLPKEKAPEALYLLTMTYLRDGELEKFREAALKCARHYPYDPLADDCLYLLGVVMSQRGELDAAVEVFKRLLDTFPGSEKRDEALWQMGWAFYKKGDYRRAEKVLGRLTGQFPNSALAPQAIYWRGKSLEALGETASAQTHYNELQERYGLSFYGLLAARKEPAVIEQPAWEAPEEIDPRAAQPDEMKWRRDPKLARVYELLVQGMRADAEKELRAAEPRYAGSLEGLKTIAGLYGLLGDYRRPLEIASQLYRASLGAGKEEIPDEALRMLFPLRYWTTINLEAYALKMDPMLISGVIREESHYNPSAVSPAGAVGLMQLMPSTAGVVCKRLELKAASAADLKNWDFNVPIGARYLSSLIKKHGGRLARALAEYNAGPVNLDKWEKKNPGAPDDVFIENIEFMETRNYVKRVLRNYYIYKKLYETGAPDKKEKAALY